MVKEKAKGEKDILAGNVATLNFYKNMITGSLIVYAVVRWCLGFSWLHIMLSLPCAIALSVMYRWMWSAGQPSYSASGALVFGGSDLNLEGGVTDYFKDIIIVTCVVMILSLISDYFWYCWLVIPLFALVKLWTNVISPWIFAPAPEMPQGGAGQPEGPRKGMRQTKQKKQTSANSMNNNMSAFNLR